MLIKQMDNIIYNSRRSIPEFILEEINWTEDLKYV
jgi:hypothetical protein